MGRKQLMIVGKVALILVIAVGLQTLLVSRVSVLGVTADLFLILTVVVAVSRGSMEGAIFGFFAGLIADVAFFQPLGVRALIYVLVGYFVGMFVARFETVSPWGVLFLAGSSSFLAQFVFGLFQYIMGPRAAFLTMVGTQMIPGAVLDALVAVPVYVLLVRLHLVPAPPIEQALGRSAPE
ncbi:MAG: rod shape-determining protein MreD [bacterium]